MKRGIPGPIQRSFPSHGVKRVAAHFLFAAQFILSAPSQRPANKTVKDDSTAIVSSGIVVEDLGKGCLDKPVLEKGDILLSWSRGAAHGDFEAPTFFWWLGVEQHPLGRVTVHGLRDGLPGDWTLGQCDYYLTNPRPNFTDVWLRRYEQARKLVNAGKASEASKEWLAMARSIPAEHASVSAWLSCHAGRVLADRRLWKQADEAYAEAIREAGNDLDLLAPIQHSWGFSFSRSDEWLLADERSLKMLPELQAAGKKMATAQFLSTLGYNAAVHGRFQQAREHYLAAFFIEDQIAPTSDTTAWELLRLGNNAFMSGELDEAETRLKASLNLFRNAGSEGGVASALVVHANVAIARADFAAAQQYLSEAAAIETRTGNFLTAANAGLGWLADIRGDFARAGRFYHRQLEVDRKTNPSSLRLAIALTNLGSVYRESGLLVRADHYVRRALQIAQRVAPISEYTAAALGNLGEIAAARGRTREAEGYLLQSLAIEEKLESSAGWTGDVATRWVRLGDIAEGRRNLKQAEAYYTRGAEVLVKTAPSSAHYAEIIAGLANIYRQLGDLEAARRSYKQALKVLEGQTARLGGSSETRADFRARHERIYREYGDLLLQLNQPELAFEVLERSRARTLLETLAAAHADVRKGVDPELLAKERSLQATLKAKAEHRGHLLSDQHNEQELKAVEKEISNLTSGYQDVEAEIRSRSPAYAALTQPQPLSLAEIQKQLLDPDTVLLEYSLGDEHSHVFVVSSDSLHMEELPRRSRIEAASRRVYELVTARNLRQKDASPAARIARVAQAEAGYPAASARLSAMVLGPVEKQIVGKRLLIVSDGALNYVPFPGLPVSVASESPEPLAAHHEIVNLPSASVLAILRHERIGREPAARTVAVLADPVFDAGDARVKFGGSSARVAGEAHRGSETIGPPKETELASQEESESSLAFAHLTRSAADLGWRSRRRGEVYLPRLGFSRREADAIAAVTPRGQALEALDFRASRATALGGDLANYRVVHLATHALLNSKHPELSGLVFSLVDEQGRPQNGFLDLEDIYNMNLPAELVVLSACETGLGKEISGEGLVGLTRGFMYAGASRVMASLWKIDDRATADLMRHFYQAMLGQGMRPAAALRAAQLQMLKDKRWSSPYFWAAFQIQGEWN